VTSDKYFNKLKFEKVANQIITLLQTEKNKKLVLETFKKTAD